MPIVAKVRRISQWRRTREAGSELHDIGPPESRDARNAVTTGADTPARVRMQAKSLADAPAPRFTSPGAPMPRMRKPSLQHWAPNPPRGQARFAPASARKTDRLL